MISKLLRMECVKISMGRTGERERERDTKSSIFRDGEISKDIASLQYRLGLQRAGHVCLYPMIRAVHLIS